MLYYIIRPLTHLGFLAFCKKIYLSNTQSIPKDRPVILASNHPTAFLEPCILASFMMHPLHYLVRGDFFRHPFYRRLLYSLHLLPIHRGTNASFKELKQNVRLMEIIGQQLNENVTLMILVEGSASVRKGLRPIQKGWARIAFDFYETYNRDDLVVIPVGANFDDPTDWRMTPMIHLGEALPLKNYLSTYETHKSKAIKQLMDDVKRAMRQHIIHVEEPEDDLLVEHQLEMHRNDWQISRFPIVERQSDRLHKEIAVVEYINHLSEDEKQRLRTTTTAYFNALEKQKLNDKGRHANAPLWHLFFYLLGFPIFAIGFLVNSFPAWLGKRIAKQKIKKKIQYLMPVAWGISNLGYSLLWIIGLLISAIIGQVYLFLFILIAPLLGYFSIHYIELFNNWRHHRRWKRLSRETRKTLLELRQRCLLNMD